MLVSLEEGLLFINKTLNATSSLEVPKFSVQSIIPVRYPSSPPYFQLLPDSNRSHYLSLSMLRQINNDNKIFPQVVNLENVNLQLLQSGISLGFKPVVSSTIPLSVSQWRQVFGDKTYQLWSI